MHRNKLLDYLKESNREQADHIFEKLRQIGCTVHKVTDRDIVLMTFTEDEVEIMAEMEHARWNVERLLDGWKWGDRRDVTKKTSPYLVGWSELPDDVKEWDRQYARYHNSWPGVGWRPIDNGAVMNLSDCGTVVLQAMKGEANE